MPDTRESFSFAPARRQGVGLFVGVAGGTGSGKTYSALRLARGIAGPDGKIAAVDTEARRMSHYDKFFKFDVADMQPPFRPERFAQAAEDAERAGYAVLVIDSFSLEWMGEGGVLEWHDELAGNDPKKNMSAWIKPKTAHKAMIASFLQRRIPLVLCMRAEEKVKVGAGGRPEPMGWMPIGDQRFMYELTTMLTLANDAPGIVNYKLPHKVQEQHRSFFRDGQHITEEAGAMLAAWARGDDVDTKKPTAQQQPDTSGKPFKWKSSSGKLSGFDTAEAWAKAMVKAVAGWPDDALQSALDTNIAEIRSHMTDLESPDFEHASAILRAFSDRGVLPPPVKAAGDEKELPL